MKLEDVYEDVGNIVKRILPVECLNSAEKMMHMKRILKMHNN